jgi:hypothetical protein
VIVDSSILIDARSAALLAPWLRGIVRNYIRDGGVIDPALAELLHEVERVGRAYRNSDHGTHGIPAEEHVEMIDSWISATEAAKRLGVTTRAVVARCGRGTLPARLVAGRWLIDPIDLEEHNDRTPDGSSVRD